MKNKNCPYCGRRIPYTTLFRIKNKGTYECTRCKKQSKIKLSSSLIISFAAVFLSVVLFMIIWCVTLGMANSFFGVIITALILIIYYFCTPVMINFVPLKKYFEGEKKKNGEEKAEQENYYSFNREAFDEVKRRKSIKNAEKLSEQTRVDTRVEDIINSIEQEKEVPIIENVSEAHASSSNLPLQRVNRRPRQTSAVYEELEPEEEIKSETQRKRKAPDGTKYTANRRL